MGIHEHAHTYTSPKWNGIRKQMRRQGIKVLPGSTGLDMNADGSYKVHEREERGIDKQLHHVFLD